MARKRMISPEFWSDEKIAGLEAEARLLFIGIWNFADDEGIFKNHPSLIASEIFPYEKIITDKIEKYLKRLEELNLVFFYNFHGQGYGIILNFRKHQSISHPQPSKLPRPSIQNINYREAIFKRDGFICGYCHKELKHESKYPEDRPTIAHIIAEIKGGSHLPDNLITACEHCNKGKKDKDVNVFRERSGNDTGIFPRKSSQVNLSQVNISQGKNCDQFITLMTGLDLKTKDQVAILQEWCGGLKARTRCISYEKCRADFKGIIKRAQDQKEKIRDFSAYLKKAVDNHLIEGPK